MSSEGGAYDVAIVGAGIVGLFIAHELSKFTIRTLVIEKEAEPGFGVSKGHAGAIHVIQLPFKSLKSILAIYGNRMYDRVAKNFGVKLWRLPTLLVAQSKKHLLIVPLFYAILRLYYGLKGFRVSVVSGKRLRELEPNVNGYAAIRVDGYGVIDSFDLIYKLYEACRARGVDFAFNCILENVKLEGDFVVLETTKGVYRSKFMVNAAGLYSDTIASMTGDSSKLEARRGVMVVFDKLQVRSIVAPLRLALGGETKGGGIIPTVWGKTIWGPGFKRGCLKEDRGAYADEVADVMSRFSGLVRVKGRVLRIYAGVRPSHPRGDFNISYAPLSSKIVNIIGIESPGLTAAPAIAAIAVSMLKRAGLELKPRAPVALGGRRYTKDLLIVDKSKVRGDRGIIICPCMCVSLADVAEAIKSGATTLDGVIFRTKLGMGSCQGQNCIGRAIVLIQKLTGWTPSEITKSGGSSWLVE